SAPWADYRGLYDGHGSQLVWQRASYLSLEQQRRRACASTLPQEHYDLAVLRHQLIDPDTGTPIPCRVLFVFSTADAKVCRGRRRGPVRWPVRAGDDGTPERKCRRPVHRVQAAERGGTGPPSVEDALGGSSGVPEESAPCRGPGSPAADRVDGLPPVAAAVSAARRRRRSPDRETHDDRDDPACVPGLHVVAGAAPLRPDRPPDGVDGTAASDPAALALPDPGSIPGPEVTASAAIAQQTWLVAATPIRVREMGLAYDAAARISHPSNSCTPAGRKKSSRRLCRAAPALRISVASVPSVLSGGGRP